MTHVANRSKTTPNHTNQKKKLQQNPHCCYEQTHDLTHLTASKQEPPSQTAPPPSASRQFAQTQLHFITIKREK